MSLLEATAGELRDRIVSGDVSAEEVARAFLERIDRVEPAIHAFLTVRPEAAIERARRLDETLRRGEPAGPLHGVPLAVKDIVSVADWPCTCGSRILEGYVAPYDATAVRRLVDAGAVVVGKTNLDEFAMGSSNESSAFGPTRNPWDRDRVPGGSSGGSAAAVAAREVPVALGTDTGGSVRQPAAFCGVVGLKPTYGRVSRYGLVAFASSLDQIGPIARTTADAARLLEAMAGFDPLDATTASRPAPSLLEGIDEDPRGLRIGVPRELADQEAGLDGEVSAAFRGALDHWRGAGVETLEVELPRAREAVACYYLVSTAEASSNLARYDGVRYGRRAPGEMSLREMYRRTRGEGFGREVKRRIVLGTYVLSAGYYEAYYLKAQKVRTLLREDFRRAFERVDAIALPTTPSPPFRLGEKLDDPLTMYLSDVFTLPASLAGLPAVSVPSGATKAGLPLGVQLVGRPFDEATILRLARALEVLTGLHRRTPPL